MHDFINNHRKSKLGVIGFPYDENSSFMRGAADAPPLIRSALRSEAGNLSTETGGDLAWDTMIFDAGDVCLPAENWLQSIESAVMGLLNRGLGLICLGGDHSITYPILKAFRQTYSELSILQIDAHPDLYQEFQGNRYSHACPFARIMEEKLARRLVQVGVRAINRHQAEQAARLGVEVIEMKHWRAEAVPEFETPLYISLDTDGLDPAFAPGVSHPEPGGFSTREVIGIIHSLKANIVGADIVEFNPHRDPLGITAAACAKLFKEIAARILQEGESEAKNI